MSGEYIEVRCQDCENEQPVYTKSSTTVVCQVCGRTLSRPTGGEAEIVGEVVDG